MGNSSKIKKLLIVDDNEILLHALVLSLEEAGYEVTSCQNPNDVEELLENGDFDAIISDMQMPQMTGLELLKTVREKSTIPFILMTAFSHLLETNEAAEKGATDFITKPFKVGELIAALEYCEKPVDSELANYGESYCPVAISEYITGTKMLSDIYIRLFSGRKFLKVGKKGDEVSIDRLARYKDKGLRYLYITNDDFKSYVKINIVVSKQALKRDLPQLEKIKLLKHTTQSVLEESYLNGVDQDRYEEAKNLVYSTISIVSDSDDAVNLLTMLKEHSGVLFSHSVGVSVYSSLIGKKMGWTSDGTLIKLSMGGLFHDIGKKEIPNSILQKSRSLRTGEEQELYETHPIRSHEILSDLTWIPEDVLSISAHHHEDLIGKGFPLRLSRARIHPLARIVGLTDHFCHHALASGDFERADPHATIQKIYENYREKYDIKCMHALMTVFGYSVPDELANRVVNRLK